MYFSAAFIGVWKAKQGDGAVSSAFYGNVFMSFAYKSSVNSDGTYFGIISSTSDQIYSAVYVYTYG